MLIVPFELFVGGWFLWTVAQAVRDGGPQIAATLVLPALLFFAWLEALGAAAGHYYYHPAFHVWLGTIPLFVPLGWLVLLWWFMWTTNHAVAARWTVRPVWALALSDGVVGVTCNLLLDAVAHRLGWWRWVSGEPGFFLSPTPLRSTAGLFAGVVCFTGLYRALQQQTFPRRVMAMYGCLAVLGAVRWLIYHGLGQL